MSPLSGLVAGALAMGYCVACLYFLKFWRDTRDRLFALFAAAFGLLAVQRVALALVADSSDGALPLYVLRLIAFLLIAAAVIDKNRAPS